MNIMLYICIRETEMMTFNYVETDQGCVRADLTDKPETIVAVGDSKVLAVFEYCNFYGLRKTEL